MGKTTVKIGGDGHGNVILAGERNVMGDVRTRVNLPPAESVDILKELAAIREILMRLETPNLGKIDRALTDAEEEAAKPEPDKDEIGTALERVMKHAEKVSAVKKIADTLEPHVLAASAWLGGNWHHIAKMFGM